MKRQNILQNYSKLIDGKCGACIIPLLSISLLASAVASKGLVFESICELAWTWHSSSPPSIGIGSYFSVIIIKMTFRKGIFLHKTKI